MPESAVSRSVLDNCPFAYSTSEPGVYLTCAGRHKVKGLTAGLPPSVALWNLKLALAYYNTSQINLLSELTAVAPPEGEIQ